MISVVTVVKNDLKGFLRTQRSVESQSYSRWEHVVVAASRKDSTFLFLEKQLGVRVVFSVQEGEGIYSAMNQGLVQASGEFLVFLNAGDVFADPESLKLAASRLQTTETKWGIFGGYASSNGVKLHIRPCPSPTPKLIGFGQAGILHPAVFYRKSFLLSLKGYDESYTIAGDLVLNIRACVVEEPLVVDQPVVIFYSGGISTTRIFYSIHEAFRARRENLPSDPVTVFRSFTKYLAQLLRAMVRRLTS